MNSTLLFYLLILIVTVTFIVNRQYFSWKDRNHIALVILAALFWPVYWVAYIFRAFVSKQEL